MKKYIVFLFIPLLLISFYFLYENYQNKDFKSVKIKTDKINGLIINENNSKVIKLNSRKNNLPFHPVKLIKLRNFIYYIDSGKIFTLNLNSQKISQIKIPFYTHEIVNMTSFGNTIYFLDKLNLIYLYNTSTGKFTNKLNFNYIKDIEPQFISITKDEKVYILDNSQNKIFYINKNNLYTFNQNVSNNLLQNSDLNLTESIDFYKEKNNFYILNRGNTLKVISGNTSDEYNIIQQQDSYNYLKLYSAPYLKNLYFSGAYNGNIIAVSKEDKTIKGNYYLKYQNKNLPVYDLFIEKNVLYILSGNYLFIHNNFNENKFNQIPTAVNSDLLSDSINSIALKNIKIPLDNGTSLPLHASVYPGARRLYRYGIHEGIDFFENVSTSTPVIACKKGKIIRIDKEYKQLDKISHDKILKKCKQLGYTSADIADLLRGRQVVIQHDNNVISIYAHLSKVNNALEINQEIDQGDILGYVGNSGTTDDVNKTGKGLHLHFELHINDKTKNLEYYLGKYLTVEESMQIYQKILE